MSSLALNGSALCDALDGFSLRGGRYALLGEYPELPQRFKGRDIDIVVNDLATAEQCFRAAGWVLRDPGPCRLQAFALSEDGARWVTVDMISPRAITNPEILQAFLDESRLFPCGMWRAPASHLLGWKLVKRLQYGMFREPSQLSELASWWREGDPATLRACQRLLISTDFPTSMLSLLEEVRVGDLTTSDFVSRAQAMLGTERRHRERRRIVRDGAIQPQGIARQPEVVLRWLRGAIAPDQSTLLSVAIVGNDAAGKSLLCNYLKREILLKSDPVHFVMRRNDPVLPPWRTLRLCIQSMLQRRSRYRRFSWRQQLLESSLAAGDYIDRLLRYSIGHTWARAGLGITIFERYPTDRTRGEFDRQVRRLHPLEQFFPMPDLVILIDIDPNLTLQRKPEDGHTLPEMTSKRNNYQALVSEIFPSVTIDGSQSVEDVARVASRCIWEHCRQKQASAQDYPAKWSPKTQFSSGDSNFKWMARWRQRNRPERMVRHA